MFSISNIISFFCWSYC